MMAHISEPAMLTCVWLCAFMILYALSFYRCFLCLNHWLLSGIFGCNAWAGVSLELPDLTLPPYLGEKILPVSVMAG